MSILDYEYVLATTDGRSIFNFYPTMTAARDDMKRANKGISDVLYEPMTYTEFKRREKAFWLDAPATQITAETWEYMLGVLPPMKWENGGDFNSFLMSEMMSGSYTHQYVRYGVGDNATYWEKMVDACDRSTWLKRGEQPEATCAKQS